MTLIVPPHTEFQFADAVFNRRVNDERDVMLGQDALRPDPITMTIRRGIAALSRLFQRDQEPVPDVAIVQPTGDEPVRLPVRDDRDLAA